MPQRAHEPAQRFQDREYSRHVAPGFFRQFQPAGLGPRPPHSVSNQILAELLVIEVDAVEDAVIGIDAINEIEFDIVPTLANLLMPLRVDRYAGVLHR